MNKIKYAEKARDSILDIVVDNFDYLREHPKQLAWVLMKWNLIHTASRIAYGACEDNPKYAILDAGEKLGNSEDGDLLYDAWGVSISNEAEFPDPAREPNWEKLVKPNKTLDEWIDIKTDPQYKYSSLYPNERRIIDNLLCTIGTGMSWNKDGFITDVGPSGVDENIFAGYTLAEPDVRKDIRSAINKFLNSKTLKGPTDDYMKKVEINWGDNKVEKIISNDGWKVEQALREHPKLIPSALKAFRFVAYLDVLIATASKWDDEQWAKACKKSTWRYKNHVLNVSQVQPNFIYSAHNFEFELSMAKKRRLLNGDLRAVKGYSNARDSAWSDFVFKTNETPEVKKAQKVLLKKISKNKPSNKKLDKAKETLRSHQPNHSKYIDLYTRAHEGDKEAIKELNKVVGIPKSGWASVKFIVEHERKVQKSLESFYTKSEKQATYYPICEYSNMITMPKNAHSSYVRAAIKVAQEIINNKDERTYSKKYAKKFLKQWET